MNETNYTLEITPTKGRCPAGEAHGSQCHAEGKIPVISCEGACIRGEIARQAANLVAKEEPYRRACHGELLAVPDSAIAHWVKEAQQVVLIDGCFLRCHGRILEQMIPAERLVQFDALSHYKRYTEFFDSDAIPTEELDETARDVADWVLSGMQERQSTAA